VYFILVTFSGILGHFEAGTERAFADGTARLLKAGGHITEVGSTAHLAWLAANAPASDAGTEAEQGADPQPELETKPDVAPEPVLETKPAPAAKTARKAK